jgi:hypothetical protein
MIPRGLGGAGVGFGPTRVSIRERGTVASASSLRFGLWYDFRNPQAWRQDPVQLYEAIFCQVERAEALGWHDVWLSEHHFIDDDYTPSMLPLAAAIAARTRRVEIGTSVLLLPLHDPLRVAEDAATVDVTSGGRFQLGLGVGYRVGEFEGFGIPRRERAARMEEAVPLLRRLFAGERVSSSGYYNYREVELRPRPVQRSMKLWMGGFTAPAVRRAARLGDAYIAISRIPVSCVCTGTSSSRSARTPTPTRSLLACRGYWWRAIPNAAGERPKPTFSIRSTATPNGSPELECRWRARQGRERISKRRAF